jgi:hypothetical protein
MTSLSPGADIPSDTHTLIDSRLRKLSYSSRLLLHSCPRKYQLYRLNAETTTPEEEAEVSQSVTFAFGTVVGVGIQELLQGATLDAAILAMFLEWEPDLLAYNTKQKKSFFTAVFAVQHFDDIRGRGYLDDYELVTTPEGKPAVELSFQVSIHDSQGTFYYRGYVDAVLRHTLTNEILVLELKTTSGQINSATYKNSSQAIGYSVVLDKLFPDLSSYQVLYLVYSTKSMGYEPLIFEKSLLQRALWLQELLVEIEKIKLYETYGYPMHGESCFSWYRECEYLGLCTLSTERLVNGTHVPREEPEYIYNLTFDELVESQIAKGGV